MGAREGRIGSSLAVGSCGRLWAAVGGCGERVLHCSLEQLKLVLGLHHLHDFQDPGLTFYIARAIKHPGYNLNYGKDLALLKVQD